MKVDAELTRDVPTIAATAAKLEDADAGIRMAAINMLHILLHPKPSNDDVIRSYCHRRFSDWSEEESAETPALADDPGALTAITAIGDRLEDADPRVRTVALETLSGLSRSLLERQKAKMAEALRPYAAAITATEEMHLCLLLDRLSPAPTHIVRPAEPVQRPLNQKRPLLQRARPHVCAHALPTLLPNVLTTVSSCRCGEDTLPPHGCTC